MPIETVEKDAATQSAKATESVRTLARDLEAWATFYEAHADEFDALDPVCTPYLGPCTEGQSVEVWIQATSPEQFAALARILADGAPIGSLEKSTEDGASFSTVDVRRMFGDVAVKAWVDRSKVCTKVQTGTRTEVTTALTCIHCDVGIRQMAINSFTHHDGDGIEYFLCRTGGTDATPPLLNEVSTTEVPVYEYECSPILAASGSTGGERR